MEGKLVLAPLAGYTDKAFREIATKLGADETVTEMVSAEGLSRDSKKTEELLERFEGEKHLVVQLFGSQSDQFNRCLNNLMKYNPVSIDINAGCPVPKVVKTGAGSALMQNPKEIYNIVKVVKEGTSLPVSVKFRLGWDNTSINYLEFASYALEGGASSLTLHARTRSQGYSGVADKTAFKVLKEYFKNENVRIYASGDIFTPEDAAIILNQYNLDGVMFARGAIGNPFIFRQTKEYLKTKNYTLPTIDERIDTALEHYDLMVKYYGADTAGKEMRKHIMAYVKGIRGGKEVKEKVAKAGSRKEYQDALSLLKSSS